MTRPFGVATLNELEAGTAHPIHFVELQFDSGTERFSSGLGSMVWGGNTWLGVGQLAEIEGVEEGIEVTPYAARMGLSGITAEITDIVFNTNYYRRPVIIYLGATSSNGTLLGTPTVIFSGRVESVDLTIASEDGDAVLLTAENELVDFERLRNVRFTENQLQAEYPGDLGMEWLEQTKNAKPVWLGDKQAITGRSSGASPVSGLGSLGLGGLGL